MTVTTDQSAWFSQTFSAMVANCDKAVLGKEHVIRLALTCMLSEGHLLLEDFPGTGKTLLARAMARAPCRAANCAHPVHPRPAAERRHRRDDLRPGHQGVRVPPRPDLRHDRARRRDQPRLAQDPVGAARGDGGGPGHRRRRRPRGRRAVHGHRHPEPHRAGRHLPAARGPARPLPDEDLDRLPRPRRHRAACCATPRPATAPRPFGPVVTSSVVTDMAALADEVHVDPAILDYVSRLAEETRAARQHSSSACRCAAASPSCAAPRPGPSARAATTWCPTTSRCSPSPVLCHRLLLTAEAQFAGVTVEQVITQILAEVAPPTERLAS